MVIRIGCAGWALRKEVARDFPLVGTHLERYAHRLNAVEINSSFYRSHRASTYRRWAASTPSEFSFAVKLPKQITHVRRLVDVESQIEQFRIETAGLGDKLGPVLVQLPPSLAFDLPMIEQFFSVLRAHLTSAIVCEPRHPTWFTPQGASLMQAYEIGRVAADPSVVPDAAIPGGYQHDCYFRWHGSPRMYYSSYGQAALVELRDRFLRAAETANTAWCIFDNTADGAALNNALMLAEMCQSMSPMDAWR